jgi:uncharacterized protein
MSESRRETSWLIIGLAALTQVAASVWINGVLFQEAAMEKLRIVYKATAGLVAPTLVGGILLILTVVVIVMFLIGRLRPQDVGWRRRDLLPALAVTAGFWAVMQGVLAALALVEGRELALNPAWLKPGASFVLGGLIAQLLGNAFAEETIFRGFLPSQLHLKFGRRQGRIAALVSAALASQVFFALLHLPNRLFLHKASGSELFMDQLRLTLFGLGFLLIYLVTRNLWTVVGLHALGNQSVPLLEASQMTVALVWVALALLLVILWRPAARLAGRRGSGAALAEAGAV